MSTYTIFLILIAFLGAAIGSFLNVVAFRLPNKKTGILKGRSYCPKCNEKLTFLDLVPLLSFVFLGRKCRHCSKSISWQYWVMELVTALVFVVIAIQQIPLSIWPEGISGLDLVIILRNWFFASV